MGLAMASTLLLNVYGPWGRLSGAHLNPAVTLAFVRLGRARPAVAGGYIGAQLAGALLGVLLAAVVLGGLLAHPSVHYVATVPGRWGSGAAFLGELGIAFLQMTVVLACVSRPRLERWTGVIAATLVALYITVEAPVSGMSMNPARTLGSALPAWDWTGLWVYLAAPLLGMLGAAEVFARTRARQAAFCAKLRHDDRVRCIFCGHQPRPIG
jgi:aquaporin Z